MNMLASLRISTKILLLVLMLGAVTVAIAFAGALVLTTTADANTAMVKDGNAALYLARANRRATEMVYAGYRAMAHDGASRETRDAAATEQKMYESGKTLFAQAAASRPSIKAVVAGFDQKLDSLHAAARQAIGLAIENRNDEALALLTKADASVSDLGKRIADFNNRMSRGDDARSDVLDAAARSSSFWLLALSLAGVAVSIGVSLIVSRLGIIGPLARLKATMLALAEGNNGVVVDGADRRDELGDMAKVVLVFQETAVAKAGADAEKVEAETTVQMVVATLGASLTDLSNRDLTTRVAADYPGPYAVLKDNYNEAVASVRTTIAQVSESAAAISTGADEIAQASEDLARRTESNAASLEETSAALTQMEGRLKASATASHSTVARADQAMATVDTGRSTAETAMAAMGRVSGSAKGIDDVIEGLDKIAFQTRVLAMNAAVEAGRAGDAGRGFAVVADLVSALAMRAEEEAKRARDQLTVTQGEIVTAVEAVGKVDTALAAISTDVGEVNKLLAVMASDNQAQSSTISEITAAVSTMDRATQQNAAMVEQTSAAARNLTEEVSTLTGAAAQFIVEVAAPRHAAASAARKPIIRPATPAAAAARRPAAMPQLMAVGHANGHANGKTAAPSDWSDF